MVTSISVALVLLVSDGTMLSTRAQSIAVKRRLLAHSRLARLTRMSSTTSRTPCEITQPWCWRSLGAVYG